MDKYQKQVQLELLGHEEKNKKRLAANYKGALKEIKKKLSDIMESSDIEERKHSRAKWGRMLEAQLSTILNKLGEKNVSDMTQYLDSVYREAYLGCLYGMHQDGVGLIIQIDEDKVERSLNRETERLKFSQRLYENADKLKQDVKEEIARGFSAGRDYISVARQISLRAGVSIGRACTIARTEGHRITEESRLDCMKEAVSKGAETVKQWDSTLDDKTRGTHRELDGQVREVDEPFEIPSTGAKAMYPGGFGIAKEDINCRCVMITRARWALDDEEYKYSRSAGAVVSIKSDVYKEWKGLYNKYADILFSNTEGRTTLDNAANYAKLIQAISKLPPKSQLAMLDAKYEFGGNRCYCDVKNRIIRYSDKVTDKELYHEMGHLLEKDMFPAKEVEALKRKYLQGVSLDDVYIEEYVYSDGVTGKKIFLVSNEHLLESYQGRIYVEKQADAFDIDGNLRIEKMFEFMSVPISCYCTNPEKLLKADPEMYEFIERYMK